MENLLKIFSRECKFIAGAADIKAIPTLHLPEFAFIGRSNVGKSSLINALVKRKSMARVSQTPGCTKQINFFNLDDKVCIVDLPGYGFARLSNKERNTWNSIIHKYLSQRKQLIRVFLLLDSRHEIKEIDKKTMSFLDDCAISYQIVMTKIDKLGRSFDKDQLLTEIKKTTEKYASCHPEIILTSKVDKSGIEQLQNEIINLISRF